jgi:hypothetical protein
VVVVQIEQKNFELRFPSSTNMTDKAKSVSTSLDWSNKSATEAQLAWVQESGGDSNLTEIKTDCFITASMPMQR